MQSEHRQVGRNWTVYTAVGTSRSRLLQRTGGRYESCAERKKEQSIEDEVDEGSEVMDT